MSKKKKVNKTNPLKVQKIQKVLEQQQPEKNNTLIFGGVLLAISSIGLLIFVLSDKVFHLSWYDNDYLYLLLWVKTFILFRRVIFSKGFINGSKSWGMICDIAILSP